MSDLQRDKFEAWAKSEDINTVKYGATGVYCYPDAHAAWIVWQAAIESIAVKLSGPSTEVDCGYELNDIQNLLTDAGIKYE